MQATSPILVYRASVRYRALAIALGGAMTLGGLGGVAFWGSGHDVSGPLAMGIMVTIALGGATLGLGCVASSLRQRVTLSADAIEQQGIFATRRMRVADIEGFRVARIQGMRQLFLEPKQGIPKGLEITLTFSLDDAFLGWLDKLVDLGERDAREKLQRVRQKIALGNSPDERVKHSGRAHRLASCMSWAATAAALWAIVYPEPYILALGTVALLPWIVLWMYWHNPAAYTIADEGLRSTRASLYAPILVAGFTLLVRALVDVTLVDWTLVIIPALACGALLALAAGAARSKIFDALLAVMMFASYPAGLLPLANVYFDNASPRAVVASVDATRLSTGKRTTYHAQLSPWIGSPSSEVEVDKALYEGLSRGDLVCVLVYPGALRFEWVQVRRAERCKRGPPA